MGLDTPNILTLHQATFTYEASVKVHVCKRKDWDVTRIHELLNAALQANARHVLDGCGVRITLP